MLPPSKLTELLAIRHPVLLAPMAGISGVSLATAVSDADGLGFLGGGYCEGEWLKEQLALCDGTCVGIGFITWVLPRGAGWLLRSGCGSWCMAFGGPLVYRRADCRDRCQRSRSPECRSRFRNHRSRWTGILRKPSSHRKEVPFGTRSNSIKPNPLVHLRIHRSSNGGSPSCKMILQALSLQQ